MLLDPVLSHVWLSHWPRSEKRWLRIRELYIVVLRLSSKAMERQFFVRSWMDILVPFVHVTESAHYCYLQKLASTKQVFRIVGFFMKKVSSILLQSLKLQELKEWIPGVLSASLISFSCAWNSVGQIHPLIFQHNGQLHRFPLSICQHHGELHCLVFVLLWVEAAGGHFTWLDLQTLWKLLFR